MKQKPKSDKSQKCLAFNTNVGSIKTIFKTLNDLTEECDHFFGRFPIDGLHTNQLNEYKAALHDFKLAIEWPKSSGRPKKPIVSVLSSEDESTVLLPKPDSEGLFHCYWPKCVKTFGQNNSLISHIESYHLRKERHKCCVESCGQVFSSKLLLTSHMTDQHSTEVEHRCAWIECQLTIKSCSCLWPNCGQWFSNREAADNHMEETHLKRESASEDKDDSSDPKLLRCSHSNCSFETMNEHDFNDHESGHKYIPINQRKNKSSNETTSSKSTDKAVKRKRRPKNFRCTWPACEAVFESQHTVAIHMRKHTGEKPFLCDWPDCGKSFRFRGGLKLHKDSTHLKIKQYKCDLCGEGFLLQSALTVHKSKHTGVKKYECDWPGCEWRTNFSQQLDIHRQRTHEGKKVYLKRYNTTNSDPTAPFDAKGRPRPYSCQWPGCDRRFRLECNLEPHIRWHQKTRDQPYGGHRERIGKGRKQKSDQVFECDWSGCMARYTTRHMLKQHMNTHTGQRPYACKLCPQSFAMTTQLRTHTIAAHPGFHQNKRPNKTRKSGHSSESSVMASTGFHSDSPDVLSLESDPYIPQSDIIRLNQMKAYNSLQIQTQNPMDFIMAYRRDRMTPTPVHSTHTTARKLLTNAKRVRTVGALVSVDSEAIARECPHPCPQSGCWRRFRTQRTLEWHIKKSHPGFNAK